MSLEPEIPPITDPMGRSWEQPPVSEIEFRNGNAWMTLATFNKLCAYNGTFPSGVYVGKMFRRDVNENWNYALSCGRVKGDPKPREWKLVWFSESAKPGYVDNNYAPIKLIDALAEAQL